MRGFYGYGMGYSFPWWNIVSWVIGIGVIAAIIFLPCGAAGRKRQKFRQTTAMPFRFLPTGSPAVR